MFHILAGVLSYVPLSLFATPVPSLPAVGFTKYHKSVMLSSALFSAIVLLATEAAAHGAVTSYVIAGVTYPG